MSSTRQDQSHDWKSSPPDDIILPVGRRASRRYVWQVYAVLSLVLACTLNVIMRTLIHWPSPIPNAYMPDAVVPAAQIVWAMIQAKKRSLEIFFDGAAGTCRLASLDHGKWSRWTNWKCSLRARWYVLGAYRIRRETSISWLLLVHPLKRHRSLCLRNQSKQHPLLWTNPKSSIRALNTQCKWSPGSLVPRTTTGCFLQINVYSSRVPDSIRVLPRGLLHPGQQESCPLLIKKSSPQSMVWQYICSDTPQLLTVLFSFLSIYLQHFQGLNYMHFT